MPIGSGYFMDLLNYELIPITEHFTDVLRNPKRFRLEPGEVKRRDRDKTLTNVLKHDFARIRMPNPSASKDFTFEGYGTWNDIMSGVLAFAQKQRMPRTTYITMANLKDNTVRQETLADIVSGDLKSSRFGYIKKFGDRLILSLGRTIARRIAERRGLIDPRAVKPATYGRQLLMALSMRDARRHGQ